jgi:hypothetical protein
MARWTGLIVFLLALRSIAFAQADPKTALLERAGWEALAAGRAHEAANAFRDWTAGTVKPR